MRLIGWEMKEQGKSLAAAIGAFVGTTLLFIMVGIGGMFGESSARCREKKKGFAELIRFRCPSDLAILRRDQLRERMKERRIMIGI